MASTSAEPVAAETSSDIDVDALKLIGQGKRHLVMGEVPTAVNCFQEASELLGAKYGETATECGEAYFDYGRALLELGRMETGVLGNALEGVPEEDDDDDDDDVEEGERKIEKPENVTDAEKPGSSTTDKKDETATTDKKDKEVTTTDKKDGKTTTTDKKDGKTATTDKKDETATTDKKDETATTDKKEETATTDKKEVETATTDKKDETTTTDKKDKDTATTDKKGETATTVKKGETATTVKKGETATTVKKGETATTVKKGETATTVKKDGETATTDKKDEEAAESKMEDDDDDDDDDEDGESAEAAGGTEGEEDVAEGAASKEESEDVSNFQLGWEMLELAKLIFGRQEGKEGELRVAQCHLKLGEVALETENYGRSVEDFEACLAVQVKHLEAENRLLAETRYQLGLAYTFNRSFDKSIEHFNAARKVIEDRLALLTKRTEEAEQGKGKEKASTDDPLVADQKEIKDLKDLIPDIMAKIEDAEEMKKDMETAAKSAVEVAAAEFGVSSSSGDAAEKKGASAPVKDISHLVRKKRKQEDDPKEGAPSAEAKKARSEENGSGDASNCVNGKAAEVNGVNGVDNSDKQKDKQEMQTKTVEEVKKTDEADAAPMETA